MLRRLLLSLLVVCVLAGCSGGNTTDTNGEDALSDSTNAEAEPTCRAFDDAIQDVDGRACSPLNFPAGFNACMEAWPHCSSRDRSIMMRATNCLNALPECTPANQQAFQDRFADCLSAFLGDISKGCYGE